MALNERITILDGRVFTYDRDRRVLSAEASTAQFHSVERIDETDVGIAIRSPRTQRVARFALHHVEKHDGDVVAWHFKPWHMEANINVERVTLFND